MFQEIDYDADKNNQKLETAWLKPGGFLGVHPAIKILGKLMARKKSGSFYMVMQIALFISISGSVFGQTQLIYPGIEQKVDSVLALMTLEEKVGQLNQHSGSWDVTGPIPQDNEYVAERAELLKNGGVGSMLNVVGAEATYEAQKLAVENSRLGIPIIFGFDVIHGNLDSIREANFELANNPENASVGEEPVVVWMSYNVHGNEPSGSEAAMQTAYRLVAATDSETQNWLENSVVIIDPMLNPDGRDRYVYWYKSSRANILNTNPEDLEHGN